MPTPTQARPRPINAPALMMAPHRARMAVSFSVVEHPQSAGADQNHPRQDHQQTAAAAARPGAVRSARAHAVEETVVHLSAYLPSDPTFPVGKPPSPSRARSCRTPPAAASAGRGRNSLLDVSVTQQVEGDF